MKKFIIGVSTNWSEMDDEFRAIANDASELEDVANSLAYDNFESYDGATLMAEANGYSPEDMEQEDWDELYEDVQESDYFGYFIEEFTGSEEEWKEIGGEIYNEGY